MPAGDPAFDTQGTGTVELPFFRANPLAVGAALPAADVAAVAAVAPVGADGDAATHNEDDGILG